MDEVLNTIYQTCSAKGWRCRLSDQDADTWRYATVSKVDFDDVRPEEYSPSKGGAAARLDFLLKVPKVVIEAKMTRKTLTDKKLGEELIIDIARYRAHPDCEALVCLVYAPEHNIRNPSGLERDLSRTEGTLTVHVVVVPK